MLFRSVLGKERRGGGNDGGAHGRGNGSVGRSVGGGIGGGVVVRVIRLVGLGGGWVELNWVDSRSGRGLVGEGRWKFQQEGG